MKPQAFFIAAVTLGIVALMLLLVARIMLEKGYHLKAERVAVALRQPGQEEVHLFSECRLLNKLGLAVMVPAAICLGAARIRRESGWYSIPIILLLSAFLLQMFP